MREHCAIASRESHWETYDASPLMADNGGNRITAPLSLSHTRFPMQELGNAISVRLKYPAGATITQDVRVQLFGLTQDDSPSWLYDELNNDHEIVLRTSPTEDVTDGTWKWTLHTRLFTKGNAKIIVGIMRALEGSGLTGAAIELKISSIYAQPYVPRRWPLLLLGRQRTERYLFRDTFNNGAASYSDDAVRTCSPGPGEITIEGSSIAVSGNQLSLPAPSNSWASHHARATRFAGGGTTIAREAGRMVFGTAAYSGSANGSFLFGFCDAVPDNFDDAEEVIASSVGAITIINDTTTLSFSETFVSGTTYQLAVVLRAAGAFYFMKGGAFSDWTLIWITDARSNSNLIPAFVPFNRATTLDDWRVPKRLWTPAASLSVANPANEQIFSTGLADFIADIVVSRSATTGYASFVFRAVDDENYYSLTVNGSNGSASVDKVVGGSATTNLITFASGTVANPGTRTFRIMAYGSTIRAYVHTAASTTWTAGTNSPYASASDLATATGIEFYKDTGVTADSITVWKRTWNEGFPSL